MSTFHLVACVGQKLSHAAPAKDLYCSRWFALVRAIMDQRGEPWAILSARHGLVMPDAVIEPYNETLGTKSRVAREQWADAVYPLIPDADRYVIWGGENYFEFLAPMLHAELPLQHLGIGQQLQYLGRLANPAPVLIDVARELMDLLVRCDPELIPPGVEPASELQWDNARVQLKKAIVAWELAA